MTHLHSTIGNSFLANGTLAIEPAHIMDRRLAEAEARRTLASTRTTGAATGMRHTIGTLLISVGNVIAGTTATIQDRQATMPAPASKPGLVTTR